MKFFFGLWQGILLPRKYTRPGLNLNYNKKIVLFAHLYREKKIIIYKYFFKYILKFYQTSLKFC